MELRTQCVPPFIAIWCGPRHRCCSHTFLWDLWDFSQQSWTIQCHSSQVKCLKISWGHTFGFWWVVWIADVCDLAKPWFFFTCWGYMFGFEERSYHWTDSWTLMVLGWRLWLKKRHCFFCERKPFGPEGTSCTMTLFQFGETMWNTQYCMTLRQVRQYTETSCIIF